MADILLTITKKIVDSSSNGPTHLLLSQDCWKEMKKSLALLSTVPLKTVEPTTYMGLQILLVEGNGLVMVMRRVD